MEGERDTDGSLSAPIFDLCRCATNTLASASFRYLGLQTDGVMALLLLEAVGEGWRECNSLKSGESASSPSSRTCKEGALSVENSFSSSSPSSCHAGSSPSTSAGTSIAMAKQLVASEAAVDERLLSELLGNSQDGFKFAGYN